jgi:hypothetical protein
MSLLLAEISCSQRDTPIVGRNGERLTPRDVGAIREEWREKKQREDAEKLRQKRALEEAMLKEQRQAEIESERFRMRLLEGLSPAERKDFEDRAAREKLIQQNKELLEELRKINANLEAAQKP